MKVLTDVGTRPEIIRLSRVIAALDANLEHVLVHTGQNYDYELNQVFFDELGIRKPDFFLNAAQICSGDDDFVKRLVINHSLYVFDGSRFFVVAAAAFPAERENRRPAPWHRAAPA